jgi:hypothetical protein
MGSVTEAYNLILTAGYGSFYDGKWKREVYRRRMGPKFEEADKQALYKMNGGQVLEGRRQEEAGCCSVSPD